MACSLCFSENQQQIPSEMVTRFPELKSLNKTRVLVVGEDLSRAKEIVARHFEERAWEPCGEAGSSTQAIQMLFDLRPDLVVLDASTWAMECAREIRCAAPAVKICLFSRC